MEVIAMYENKKYAFLVIFENGSSIFVFADSWQEFIKNETINFEKVKEVKRYISSQFYGCLSK